MQQRDSISFPFPLFTKINATWKGQSVVDFGTNDGIDIDFSIDSGIQVTSRKTSGGRCKRYLAQNTCFPLMPPNEIEVSQIIEDVRDVWACPHDTCAERTASNLQTTNLGQLNMLFKDHPELLIGTTLDELKGFDMDILHRQFHPLKYAYDTIMILNRRQVPPENFREFYRQSNTRKTRTMTRFTRNDTHALENRHFVKRLDETLETIFEIPRGLLLDLLDEELVSKYDLITENEHLGNCLSNCEDLLIYPKGTMDTLCINPISCFDNGDGAFPEYDGTAMQNISLDEAIQEIDCKCFSDGNAIIGVRSDYSCSFLTKSFQESSKPSENHYFNLNQTLTEKSRILSMAVNPHFINDAVICLENGTINCWRDGVVKCFSDHQIHSHPNCGEIRWVNCIYGTNPTSFLLLHPQDVYMYDTRAGPKPSQTILQLPNINLNKMDKLRRPASLHPVNPHQMLLTSELGLIVMDERFTNTPLVSVNHYMRSSPQFLRVSDYDCNSEFRTLALLGGYRYRDTRLIELTQGSQPISKMLRELTSATCKTQPPASVGSPRKLSYPDSWLQVIKNDCRVVSPAVIKRMTQPLIGVSILPVKSSPTKDLLALQLTKPGDLFYQILRTGSEADETEADRNFTVKEEYSSIYEAQRTECVISDKMEERCRNWINKACEMYNESKEFNEEANLSSTVVSTDDGVIAEVQKYQMEARARLEKTRSEGATTENSNCENREYTQDATGERGRIFDVEAVDENADEADEELQEERRGKSSIELNEMDLSGCVYKVCPVCKTPLQQDSSVCSGCNLDTKVSTQLKSAYEKRLTLTNGELALPGALPIFNRFVKNVEKSRDLVSVVLMTNWDDDENYTPLGLSLNVEGEEKDTIKEEMTTRTPPRESRKDLEEINDDWYLSASGRLEHKKEKADVIYGRERESNISKRTRSSNLGRSMGDLAGKQSGPTPAEIKPFNDGIELNIENNTIPDDSASVLEPKAYSIKNDTSSTDALSKKTDNPHSSFSKSVKKALFDPEGAIDTSHVDPLTLYATDLNDIGVRKRRYSNAMESRDPDISVLGDYSRTANSSQLNYSPERKKAPLSNDRTTPRKKKINREMGF
ncbi:uncharacterized protein LOC135692769 [Rhopilema esculentum]|uniref:uncharacterized protein LOC135692769 n=1 Tax=Rhopilema esculentum TaxID=499914 RepID=UPI0031E31F1F